MVNKEKLSLEIIPDDATSQCELATLTEVSSNASVVTCIAARVLVFFDNFLKVVQLD